MDSNLRRAMKQCFKMRCPFFPLPDDLLVTTEYLKKTTGQSDTTIRNWARGMGVEPRRIKGLKSDNTETESRDWYSLNDWGRAFGYGEEESAS